MEDFASSSLETYDNWNQSVTKNQSQENCPEFKDWVNCFIELDGLHRFQDDKKWGELLFHFRDGNATPEDINEINERVVKDGTLLPGDICYATYRNCDRDSINAAVFEEHCQHMYDLHGHTNDEIMIFRDDLKVKNGDNKYIPFNNGFNFWENCGEANIKAGWSGRMDPVLRLYSNCRTICSQRIPMLERGRQTAPKPCFRRWSSKGAHSSKQ